MAATNRRESRFCGSEDRAPRRTNPMTFPSRLLSASLAFILFLQILHYSSALGSNPCQDYSLHDCDPVAECDSEQPGYFQCKCPRGYVDVSPDQKRAPGRKCKKEENECALGTHECDGNAECVDTAESYSCRCKAGWVDVSADKANSPGRNCKRSDQCVKTDCAPEAECRESPTGPICQCTSGFVDISAQHGRPAGRVCRVVVNECAVGKHDCSSDASCIDTADAFTCRCKDGFRDDSPNIPARPGRICVRTSLPEAPECNVNDPMSCDKQKHEVCLFRDGNYKCACPNGYSRLPDGRCLVINECQDPRLNNCSIDADCVDQAEGFTCQCRSGFADVSPSGKTGVLCRRRMNECANPANFDVDCDANAVCVDTDDAFSCRCRPGFADISEQFNKLPGRKCVEAVNECLDAKLNDCSENAVCEDAKEGYTCKCRPGFVDASANSGRYPGRVCTKPAEKSASLDGTLGWSQDPCDPDTPKCPAGRVCSDRLDKGTFTCQCPDGTFLYDDNTCRQATACKSSDCDRNAACVNVFDAYRCQCRPGYFDISPDPETQPGRVCKELVNECASDAHDCSPFAQCVDATDGYLCICQDGFVDTSAQQSLLPGRKCSNASNECAERSLNTCDENADCIDTPSGYSCQCFDGYVDVSSNAHLPPGRVCTVQTTCPKQKTDLMFLIDGSGSIGSFVFKNEVLRFVRDFLELFDVGLDNTRVGLIQYSDQIRHEFDLNQYTDKQSLLQAIAQTQYLTGLTRTGAAIQHMVMEGFSERRGARPLGQDVSRVAIVITDGRSQDNVTEPAKAARELKANMFAIGVTDHVLASELEAIAGSPQRWFYVDRFKDLDMRLRSLIQKMACPAPGPSPRPPTGCSPDAQTGCDRALNEICELLNGKPKCQCPKEFPLHPTTHVCGGQLCNPEVPTSCPHPEVCKRTMFGNHRCVCPAEYARDSRSGLCLSLVAKQQETLPSVVSAKCKAGLVPSPRTGKCIVPGSCDPSDVDACDLRKREKCLLHSSGRYFTCQCAFGEKRHTVTEVCLMNECLRKEDNDCDLSGKCIDVDDGYICACQLGFLDQSPDPINRPGRVCVAERNECLEGSHHCSPDALCTDTPEGYICRCKPGFVDFSPNPQHESGLVCKRLIDECKSPQLNTCHQDALCIDSSDSYKCICKPGFTDLDELRNPGRHCAKVQDKDRCQSGEHDCDRNSRCVIKGAKDFECVCLPGFRDKSPNPSKPGRVCIPTIPECDNPSLNDCDSPDRAICADTDDGYTCRCRQGFLDISPNISSKPGRLCKALENECTKGTHDCARDGAICEDTPDGFTCRCAVGYLDVSFDTKNRPGRNCKRLIDECARGQNDCSPQAQCTDTEDSFVCACPPAFLDVSPDPVNKPGRRCLARVNECQDPKLNDCSPNADCEDMPEGYKCRCAADFIDESPDAQRKPGRICRPALVDECRLGKHDCHSDADCTDLPQGYACQCRAQFLDQSPNRITHPGRVCVPRPTPPPPECQLSGRGCRTELNEVCRVIEGVPKCACPINYNRDASTRACAVIDECQFPQLNDCHPSAECVDQPLGYTCRCRPGFKDMSPAAKTQPGRVCQALVNECQFPHLNDCHQNAQCVDLDEGYQCRCNPGFKDLRPERPGRLCQQLVNECARPELNSCDRNAACLDLENGYRCECRANFLDVSPSPTLPGRACRPIINECLDPKLNDCDRLAKCMDTLDSYTCECPAGSKDISPNPVSFPGRVCHVFENECLASKHDCDPAALCRDNEQSFACECPAGYTDRSPNKASRPGRVCVRLVDECREGRHSCSQQAECRDLEDGYTCECKDGYVDRSPNLAVQPGRVCGAPETCPANHDCSTAAICEPLGGNAYRCACIQGYEDQSPAGMQGRICTRIRNCAEPRLNNCSRNAICYDERGGAGYRCECRRGYIDKSPDQLKLKGRVCEPPPPPPAQPRHPCQEGHDCHSFAACRTTGALSFACECLPGYEDRSPDPKTKPGRVCVLTEPICLDSSRNDCHPAGICTETANSDGFTCRCRDGYTDQSPDKLRKPGRICVEQVNECLDRSLNDCDPIAVCEDQPEGYRCRCPLTAIDQSPDKKRPGRKCFVQVNECVNPALHNCSRFADCVDKPNGFECRCRTGYHDQNPKQPGTSCKLVINECLSDHMNDCSKHADCTDLPGGYTCKCRTPYQDQGSKDLPGRICRYNECDDPKMNDCDPANALCEDTDDGYTCRCKEGFYDESGTGGKQAGRVCIEFTKDPQPTNVPPRDEKLEGIPCGVKHYCADKKNEVCVGGTRCLCRPGHGRASADDVCRPVDRMPLVFRVVTRGPEPLFYSSEFGTSSNPAFVEFASEFQKDLGSAVSTTVYGPRYVTTDVSYVTHPKTVNSSWPDGLLVNFTVGTVPNPANPVDVCDLWDQLMESLKRTNGAIGGKRLSVAPDIELLDPCARPTPTGEACGGDVCNSELGEVCVAGAVCGCPNGQKRAGPKDVCRAVESWTFPIWVMRKNKHNLQYNSTFGNPLDELNKEYVRLFESGIGQCYPHTALKSAFVMAEVQDIESPSAVNASWDLGLLFNTTMHFRKGSVRVPSDTYYALIRYITDRNNFQVGKSGLYINPFQPNPFSACYKNDCHPKGICVDLGPNAYRCDCSPGYRDMKPEDAGRVCIPTKGFNECEDKKYNECSENARCIDLEYLYKCECLPGFSDSSPKGAVSGSVCNLDYCSDVNFCSSNSSCVNLVEQGECRCNHGFTDIRESAEAIRLSLGLKHNQYCLNIRDVDECALGLHNCSRVAECQDQDVGYTCRCPAGYVDGNQELPGRVCAALLCDQCNQHGDCVHDAVTNQTCSCNDGYTGKFCEVAPSVAPLILLLLLALLFLLLACCCLLWLCTKLHCFRRHHPWATLDQSASSESGGTSLYGHDMMGIPRAKLKTASSSADQMDESSRQLAHYLEDSLRIPRPHFHGDASSLVSGGSSEYTIREEIERRITTDVTTTEVVTTEADVHEESSAGAAESSTTTRAQFNVYPPPSGAAGTTSVSLRGGHLLDEQERGESIAEFSNTRGEWHQRQGGSGVSAAEYRESSSTSAGHGHHNAAYTHQENRSLEDYSLTDEDAAVYDKTLKVNRHHDFDPASGTERFRSEVATTKTSQETFRK